jgi:hypothetical protein
LGTKKVTNCLGVTGSVGSELPTPPMIALGFVVCAEAAASAKIKAQQTASRKKRTENRMNVPPGEDRDKERGSSILTYWRQVDALRR